MKDVRKSVVNRYRIGIIYGAKVTKPEVQVFKYLATGLTFAE